MSLKSDLLAINRQAAGEPNAALPYTFEDVRALLISSVKFNKTHKFKGTLPSDTVNKLRTEGLDVQLNEEGHTVVSWGWK